MKFHVYGRIWNPPLRVETLFLFRRGAFYMLPFATKFAIPSLFFVEMKFLVLTGGYGIRPYGQKFEISQQQIDKAGAIPCLTNIYFLSRKFTHLQSNLFPFDAGTSFPPESSLIFLQISSDISLFTANSSFTFSRKSHLSTIAPTHSSSKFILLYSP